VSERLPPFDRDAERCVLGSLIRDNEVIPDILGIVAANAFYHDAHAKIYGAAVDCWSSGGRVDLVILANELRSRGHSEDIGGPAYLADLLECAPTAANAEYYAAIIRDKATLRKMIHLCTEICRDAYDQVGDVDELVSYAQREFLNVQGDTRRARTVIMSDLISEVENEIDRRSQHKGEVTGIPTGLLDLDLLTSGFHPGELAIIAARPSIGKTALAVNVCINASDNYASVLFNLEMARMELGTRILCGASGVNSQAVRSGRLSAEQVRKLIDAGNALRPRRIWFDDSPNQRARQIMATCRQLRSREKINLAVIDYLQLIGVEDRRMNRNEQVGEITRSLKLMARELELPVICLSQLSRNSEQREDKRPRLSDLRDSGAIEQDADTVIFLHRAGPQTTEPTEQIEAIVAKQRNGPCADVPLVFRKATMRFENYAPGIPM